MTYAVQYKTNLLPHWVPVDPEFDYETLGEVARKDLVVREWFEAEEQNTDVTALRVLDSETREVVFFSSSQELNRAFRPF